MRVGRPRRTSAMRQAERLRLALEERAGRRRADRGRPSRPPSRRSRRRTRRAARRTRGRGGRTALRCDRWTTISRRPAARVGQPVHPVRVEPGQHRRGPERQRRGRAGRDVAGLGPGHLRDDLAGGLLQVARSGRTSAAASAIASTTSGAISVPPASVALPRALTTVRTPRLANRSSCGTSSARYDARPATAAGRSYGRPSPRMEDPMDAHDPARWPRHRPGAGHRRPVRRRRSRAAGSPRSTPPGTRAAAAGRAGRGRHRAAGRARPDRPPRPLVRGQPVRHRPAGQPARRRDHRRRCRHRRLLELRRVPAARRSTPPRSGSSRSSTSRRPGWSRPWSASSRTSATRGRARPRRSSRENRDVVVGRQGPPRDAAPAAPTSPRRWTRRSRPPSWPGRR